MANYNRFDLIDNFPGWRRAPAFLEDFATRHGSRRIGDLGGGANPMISPEFMHKNSIEHFLFDISGSELAKAPDFYTKIQVDIAATPESFSRIVGDITGFDLIFSHMFLEHIKDPVAAHSNIRTILKPGGFAVHFYPSPNNLPLAANRWLPEAISKKLLRMSQPERDTDGNEGKFPAYYKMCDNPSRALRSKFDRLGYRIVQHTAYIGHGYYDSIPIFKAIERKMRPLLLRWQIPLTSNALLVLQRDDG